MRDTRHTQSILVVALAVCAGGCTHLADFGRFVFGSDMSVADLSLADAQSARDAWIGGDLDNDLSSGIIVAAHGYACPDVLSGEIVLSAGASYTVETDVNPPVIVPPTDHGSGISMSQAALFCASSFTLEQGAKLTVIGASPLVIIAQTITIDGRMNATGESGAGGMFGGLAGIGGTPGGAGGSSSGGSNGGTVAGAGVGGRSAPAGSGAGGGGGGGGFNLGGAGGDGEDGTGGASGVQAWSSGGYPPAMQGGGGGGGAAGFAVPASGGGGGGSGGSIQLSAMGPAGTLSLGASAIIDLAGGAGGQGDYTSSGGDSAGGGGGGGAGGYLWLEAEIIRLPAMASACLSVAGGPGGNGGSTAGAQAPMATSRCPFELDQVMQTPGQGGAGELTPGAGPGTGSPGSEAIVIGGGGGGGSAGVVVFRAPPANEIPQAAAIVYPSDTLVLLTF